MTDGIGLDAQYCVRTNSCPFLFLTGVNDTMTQSFCKVITLFRFISSVLLTVWAEGISKSGVFLKLLYEPHCRNQHSWQSPFIALLSIK